MTMWLFPAPLLLLLSGFSAEKNDITGPETVSGKEQGLLTVQCHYTLKWKTFQKWWCRGADRHSCKILISTNGSKEAKKERLSIRDYQKELMVLVTMKGLRRDDAGIYWCGIQTTNTMVKVQVTVVPGLPKESLSSVRPSPATKKTTRYQATTTTSPSTQSLLSSIHFLLLVFLKLPLLLSMLVAVLWVNKPQREPGGVQSQTNENLYY